jgi:hypothetical protein
MLKFLKIKFMNKLIKKHLALIIAGIFLLTGLFFIDIGINSKFFIKKHFNQALKYRVTGNCTSFGKYIYQPKNTWTINKSKWVEKCNDEKSGKEQAINKFQILAITHKFGSNEAFLQVELARNYVNNSYAVVYEMKKSGLTWKITNEIK